MAEVESDMAGNKSKQRKESTRKGKQKKGGKKNVTNDDELTCSKCTTVFVDNQDKLLACERCDQWFCTVCVDMSDEVYKIMVERKDMHWYCGECEMQAVTAVKTDKDIEDKCAAYMKSISDRLDKMDEKIDRKAEKEKVDKLENRMKKLEDKQVNDQDDSAKSVKQSANAVRETIEEQREREFRAKNIVIFNLPESKCKEIEDRKKEDKSQILNMLRTLEVLEEDEDPIEWCSRVGQKDDKEEKTRITRITLDNVEMKRKILKKSKTLKDSDDYEEIYVCPDLTYMQRKEQYLLRKELKERREKGDKDIFIRRGKVVKASERATQFKGGATASSEEKE